MRKKEHSSTILPREKKLRKQDGAKSITYSSLLWYKHVFSQPFFSKRNRYELYVQKNVFCMRVCLSGKNNIFLCISRCNNHYKLPRKIIYSENLDFIYTTSHGYANFSSALFYKSSIARNELASLRTPTTNDASRRSFVLLFLVVIVNTIMRIAASDESSRHISVR